MEERKKKHNPPKEELRIRLVELMTELGLWKEELEQEIPTYWDNFSNFVVFNSKFFADDCWVQAGSQLWECVSKVYSGKSIALQSKIQNNEFRSPNAHLVYGDSPWVKYVDNGINYTWNVEFTMFCTGNVSERHRIADIDCEGKVVVDMFAGIGYFTLPYLVHARAKRVIACEWNPKSVEALNLNLVKNKVADKCVVYEGDVRAECPRKVADHINMGLIPSCEQYWSTAAEILNTSGGMLHVHGNVTSFLKHQEIVKCEQCLNLLQKLCIDTSNLLSNKDKYCDFKVLMSCGNVINIESSGSQVKWKKIEWFVWAIHVSHSFCEHLSSGTKTEWVVTPTFLHRVKAYAPHIDHLVVDVFCKNLESGL